ncbi:hypothetical protein K438DRAFT_2031661 [Mycena galopus ATCC 62051]|nr:hypothetical protein K438DRAFT_2031661 [Mycena galopus ATCC 62051]
MTPPPFPSRRTRPASLSLAPKPSAPQSWQPHPRSTASPGTAAASVSGSSGENTVEKTFSCVVDVALPAILLVEDVPPFDELVAICKVAPPAGMVQKYGALTGANHNTSAGSSLSTPSLTLTRISRLVSPFVFDSNHDSALPSPFSPSPLPLSAPSIAKHIWVQLESLPAHQVEEFLNYLTCIVHAKDAREDVVYFWVAALQRSLEPAEFVAWFARVFGPVIETAENPIKAEARGPDDATKDVEAEQLPAKRQMVDSEAKYMKALDTFSQLCTVPSEAAAKAKPLRPRSSSSNVVARARNLKCSAVSTKPRFL